MYSVELDIPRTREMTRENVAKIFTAYLLGSIAHGNARGQHGPFRSGSDGSDDSF